MGNRQHCAICYAVPHTAYLGSVSSSGSCAGFVSSFRVLIPGLSRRLLSGAGAVRCPCSA